MRRGRRRSNRLRRPAERGNAAPRGSADSSCPCGPAVAAARRRVLLPLAPRSPLDDLGSCLRLADRSDPIPDDVREQAARHYDEPELAGLVVAIAAINAWNRINTATRQITGEWSTSGSARPSRPATPPDQGHNLERTDQAERARDGFPLLSLGRALAGIKQAEGFRLRRRLWR
jgi:hypothetical protein